VEALRNARTPLEHQRGELDRPRDRGAEIAVRGPVVVGPNHDRRVAGRLAHGRERNFEVARIAGALRLNHLEAGRGRTPGAGEEDRAGDVVAPDMEG
jgi:hypothetical protein